MGSKLKNITPPNKMTIGDWFLVLVRNLDRARRHANNGFERRESKLVFDIGRNWTRRVKSVNRSPETNHSWAARIRKMWASKLPVSFDKLGTWKFPESARELNFTTLNASHGFFSLTQGKSTRGRCEGGGSFHAESRSGVAWWELI